MDERGQFTFYKSYWDAIEELPAKDQLPILKAIIRYALFGEEPTTLSAVRRAVFLLVKPTLDSSRKKAASGKQGGKIGKQTASKPEAPSKQTGSKKEAIGKQTASEKEREKEKEIEKENEKEKEKEQTGSTPFDGRPFTSFWEAYPKKIDRGAAWEAWKALNPSLETASSILSSLEAWKQSGQWTEDGGRFIPDAANFLTKGYWRSSPPPARKEATPKGASGELGAAELEAIRQILGEG